MSSAFVSYSRRDKEFASRFAAQLEAFFDQVWFDLEDIHAGSNWSDSIQQGLDTSAVLLLILSPDSMASVNVSNEWQYFFDQRKPIVPVMWRATKIQFQLSRLQYIDFENQPFETAFQELIAQLKERGFTLKGDLPAPSNLPSGTVASPAQPAQSAQPMPPTGHTAASAERPRVSGRLTQVIAVAIVVIVGLVAALLILERKQQNEMIYQQTVQAVILTNTGVVAGPAPTETAKFSTPTATPTVATPTPDSKITARPNVTLVRQLPTGMNIQTQAASLRSATPSPTDDMRAPGDIKVSFTEPLLTDDPNATGGVDRTVAAAIDAARTSVDIAAFDINLPSIVLSMIDAKKRGLVVRVVLDSTSGDQQLPASITGGEALDLLAVLKDANIPVAELGRSSGLMHDEFIVVDRKVLFTGSWGPNYNDTYRNDNDLVETDNRDLIVNYQTKFNEMFEKGLIGPNATVGARKPNITFASGITVQNYFSPVDKPEDKLVGLIRGARHHIRFMAFAFTSPAIGSAITSAAKSGIPIEGLFESRGATQGILPTLACQAKISSLRTDGNKYVMHHKVLIIDDTTVVTGSYNFTTTANASNDENVLIITSPALAQLYNAQFEKLYGAGKSLDLSTLCTK